MATIKSRRDFQCHQTECDSEGRWQLCLRFFCIGPIESRMELRSVSSLIVCDRHRRKASEYVLSPVNKEAIGTGLLKEGLPPPDFSSAEVIFIPVRDGVPVEEFN